MAPRKQPPPVAGDLYNFKKLEEELAQSKRVEKRLLDDKVSLESKLQEMTKEITELKKSLDNALVKIRSYEEIKAAALSGTVKEGYVEIATLPIGPNKDIYPMPTKVDGIQIPRRKDEDGVMYEYLPVKTALRVMVPGNGAYKRYLIGPCQSIEGEIPVMQSNEHLRGVYPKHFVFNKHRKSKDIYGNVQFIEVVVEDSK